MRLVALTALAVFALDQISKIWVVAGLNLDQRGFIEVFPPFLNLRMAWNYGINFGLMAGDDSLTRWVLIAVALGIVAAVLYWIRRDPPGRWGLLGAGLLIGGALGNVIDRLIYGAVADFLNMSCCGIDNPFAFNVADIAIFAGALGLVFFTPSKPAAKKAP